MAEEQIQTELTTRDVLQQVDRRLTRIEDDLRDFKSQVDSRFSELDDNKANFIGRLPLQLESNEGVAGAIVNAERHKLGIDFYQKYPALVASVTRDQILHVAQRFIDPDNLAIASAGPPVTDAGQWGSKRKGVASKRKSRS